MSKALGFSKELKTGVDQFLVLRLSPEPGKWIEEGPESWHPKTKDPVRSPSRHNMEAEVPTSYAAIASSPEGMEIRPPGLHFDLQLAGIEVRISFLIRKGKDVLGVRKRQA